MDWEKLDSLLTTLLLACCYPLLTINSSFILHSHSGSDYVRTNTLCSFGCVSPPAANVPLFSCLSHAVDDICSPSLTSAASNLPLQGHLLAISDNLGFMLAFKKGKYRCFFYWFDTLQISPTLAVVNPRNNSPPAGQVRGPCEGRGVGRGGGAGVGKLSPLQ